MTYVNLPGRSNLPCIVKYSDLSRVCNATGVTGGVVLPTLPEYLSSHYVFAMVRVAQSLFFYVDLSRSFFVLLTFSFGHYFVCPSAVRLPLWYLQTFFFFGPYTTDFMTKVLVILFYTHRNNLTIYNNNDSNIHVTFCTQNTHFFQREVTRVLNHKRRVSFIFEKRNK